MHPMVCAPPASATARASLRRCAQVRNLYKRIIITGRDYPAGLDYVRQKAKAEFAKRAHIQDDVEARARFLRARLRKGLVLYLVLPRRKHRVIPS